MARRRKHTFRVTDLRNKIVYQLDRALKEVRKTSSSDDVRIHSIRRRCKRTRALLGLISQRDGKSAIEAARNIRDAGRLLSPFRDSQIIAGAIEQIQPELSFQFDKSSLGGCESGLTHSGQRKRTGKTSRPRKGQTSSKSERPTESTSACAPTLIDLGRALATANRKLLRARKRVHLCGDDDRHALLGAEALADSYRLGRQQASLTRLAPTGVQFHELRKAIKIHLYQCKFVASRCQLHLESRIEQLEQTAEWLGQAQDVIVLKQLVKANPVTGGNKSEIDIACNKTIGKRHDAALTSVLELYFESPAEFAAIITGKRRGRGR